MGKVKKLVISASVAIALGASGVGIYCDNVDKTVDEWKDKIYPGITVEGIDLGGMTSKEAEEILSNKYGQVASDKDIFIKAGDKEVEINFADLSPEYDIDEVVVKAVGIGKDENIFKQNQYIKSGIHDDLDLTVEYNEEELKKYEEELESKVDTSAKNATISMVNGSLIVNDSVNGKDIDVEEMNSLIKIAIDSDINDNLTSNAIIVDVPVKEVTPSVTTEELASINGVIGSFTSDYSFNSTDNRATNVELALKAINGTVLMPGESFSFNNIVGERTGARGYKNAATFVGNQVVDGLGGGICQVSTALNRAVIKAGLTPTERHNHSLKASYSDYGLDSAVAWGYLDYKFTNTYETPIYIQATTNGSRVMTINIYGNAEDKGNVTYELVATSPEVTSKATVTRISDSSLVSGEEVWQTKPVDGYKSSSYIVTYQNGAEVSRKLLGTYTYSKVDGVLKIGGANTQGIEGSE
ncbi:MAG: VanW family protein [Clostridium perfringens]|nr:VanW family protein [Clostridium perfringens]